MSSGSGTPSFTVRRLWPRPERFCAASSMPPPLAKCLATSAAATPQWSAKRRCRMSRIFTRSAALLASMARSHSVSVPMERLLRLAEPTRKNRSSMIITLECIIVSVCAAAILDMRVDETHAIPDTSIRSSVCMKRMRPLRMVRASTQDSWFCGPISRVSSAGLSCMRLAMRSATMLDGEELVLDVERNARPYRSNPETAFRPRAFRLASSMAGCVRAIATSTSTKSGRRRRPGIAPCSGARKRLPM